MNCEVNQDGIKPGDLGNGVKKRLHGESWCVDAENNMAVGSRDYKKICVNGEIVLEQCDDFRGQICINASLSYTYGNTKGTFSEAACRANRWIDCTLQKEEDDCLNDNKRDCNYIGDYDNNPGNDALIECVPMYTPGLRFWEGEDAKTVCVAASVTCIAKGSKLALKKGDNWDWKGDCVLNQDSRNPDINPDWANKMNLICTAVGDCGVKENWLKKPGELSIKEMVSRA